MNRPKKLVWVDLETTGLDPEKDQILEIAVVVTDARLNEIGFINQIVMPTELHANKFILGMHTKNGLFADLVHGCPVGEVDTLTGGWVLANNADGGPICGSTPHFDKRFIDRHMPALARCFNHRVFDVSTLKLADLIETDTDVSPDDGQEPKHRALADIRYSIRCARELLGLE